MYMQSLNSLINQATRDLDASNVLYKQVPIAVGYCEFVSGLGQEYKDWLGTDCINWFVNEILEL